MDWLNVMISAEYVLMMPTIQGGGGGEGVGKCLPELFNTPNTLLFLSASVAVGKMLNSCQSSLPYSFTLMLNSF